jgi:hypothetical protein
MYIIIAVIVFAAIALLLLIEFIKRRHRRRRYPVQPDGIRRCTSCGRILDPGVTDCAHCGSDSVVIVV